MIDSKTLRLVTQDGLQNFAAGRILNGLAALRSLLADCPEETVLHAEAESLEENYHRMLSFFREGGNDAKRGEVQAKIQQGGVRLMEQASRSIRLILNKDHYSQALQKLRASYGPSAAALLDKWSRLLTPEETLEVQDDLFDYLWTAPLWSAQDTAYWYDFLLKQTDIVQQHLLGAVFLSLWEHFDGEKMQLLGLLTDSDCHRTHILSVAYLLLLRLRHRALSGLMPALPDAITSAGGRQEAGQVQREMLLMLVSEMDMEREIREAESLMPNNVDITTIRQDAMKSLRGLMELKGRYLKNRLRRGLDINLAKIPLLHSCAYMKRLSHWFLPFDKTHPLFQSVMIDEEGNEKQKLSLLMDLVMDCDVDKLALLYLISNDKDFSRVVRQLDEENLPDLADAEVPEYTFRFIMQDLYRFFTHSPLHTELSNPFQSDATLLEQPALAPLFSAEDAVGSCQLLLELERAAKASGILDDVFRRHGASASLLLLKAKASLLLKDTQQAINLARSAEMLEPDNAEVLRFLAECFARQKRFDEELEYLERLSLLLPDEEKLRFLIPDTMARLPQRREEALARYFKLDYETPETDENHPYIVGSIADVSLSLGKLDTSRRYSEKQMALGGKDEETARLRMAHVDLLEGDWKSAIAGYERFADLYCRRKKKDMPVALARIEDGWRTYGVVDKISNEDLLLIHDILQEPRKA